MKLATASQKRKRGRPCRFPDIVGAAAQIGRSREHIYAVLTGARQSALVVSELYKIGHPLAPIADAAQAKFTRRSRRRAS